MQALVIILAIAAGAYFLIRKAKAGAITEIRYSSGWVQFGVSQPTAVSNLIILVGSERLTWEQATERDLVSKYLWDNSGNVIYNWTTDLPESTILQPGTYKARCY